MDQAEQEPPQWTPLEDTERRVLGVLIEKAKTTPDNYPITISSLVNGCNQKSNRVPQMNLDDDDVEIALDKLRSVGVVVEVQGGGRVPKYRHTAYEWFDVKGAEIAVLTELLLRGAQTVGELRTRASRMEPFKDLAELQPVLDSLEAKSLAIPLTPPGRGQLYTHCVCPPEELERLKQHAPQGTVKQLVAADSGPRKTAAVDIEELRQQIRQLTDEVAELRGRLDHLES